MGGRHNTETDLTSQGAIRPLLVFSLLSPSSDTRKYAECKNSDAFPSCPCFWCHPPQVHSSHDLRDGVQQGEWLIRSVLCRHSPLLPHPCYCLVQVPHFRSISDAKEPVRKRRCDLCLPVSMQPGAHGGRPCCHLFLGRDLESCLWVARVRPCPLRKEVGEEIPCAFASSWLT